MFNSHQIHGVRFIFVVSIFLSLGVLFQSLKLQVQISHQDDGTEEGIPLSEPQDPRVSLDWQYRNQSATLIEDNITNRTGSTHSFCRTAACWRSFAQSLDLQRAFPDRHDRAWLVVENSGSPLVDTAHNRTYSDAGILYVKNFKAASSTAAGVALRLVHRLPTNSSTQGWVRFHHTPGYHYRNRHPSKSFLFTSVRDPASRALSRIFYTQVSHYGHDPYNDERMLGFLRDTDSQFGCVRHVGGGYQVWYTSMEGNQLPRTWNPKIPHKVQRRQQIHRTVKRILQEYDFIIVSERLDESIVVMALLLNVSLDDVLVQSAKQSTDQSWYYFKFRKEEHCQRPVRVVRTPAIVAHLASEEWYAKNYGDYLFHAASILSLEATIHRLGRDRVDRALAVYRSLQQQVTAQCSNQTIYHCSESGNPQRQLSKQNCYSDDSGCGYQCIDSYLATLPENKSSRIF